MSNISVQSLKLVFQQCFGPKRIPKKIAVGLSGGPDSMLLVWLLQKYKTLMHYDDIELHAITIDHNYRVNSATEAKQISQIMKQWNVNHIIEKLQYDVDPKTIANFEEVARTKRYEAIGSICSTLDVSTVLLGHHCDDQVETFVQRLQGNSSIFGLACTRQVSNIPFSADLNPSDQPIFKQVKLVRPLLGYEKATILATCDLNDIPYVVDPTNSDTKLTRRNYLRNLFGNLLPQMMENFEPQRKQKPGGGVPNAIPFFQYKSIIKSELIKSQQQCAKLARDYELKAHRLYQLLSQQKKFSELPALGSLQLKLTKKSLSGYNKIITSRFLYQKLYSYSTLNHYHWAYAKLERTLLPKLELFSKTSSTEVMRFTIMNLIFEVSNNANSNELVIHISRAPLTRNELQDSPFEVLVNKDWTQWYLFDKRFWLRFRSLGRAARSITIGPYQHKIHSLMVCKTLKENGIVAINKKLDTLPAIFQDGKIVAFPTLNILDVPIHSEWALKANKYDFVDTIV